MLEQSISSGFTEEHFDETELSAGDIVSLPARLCSYAKTMKTEQEAKTLISDISHRDVHTHRNLVLYTLRF